MSLQETTDALETRVESILKEMSITLRLFGLYPPNHPVPEEALERLATKLEFLLHESETLQLEVGKEKISAFGKSLAEGSQQVKNFSFHLFSRGISALGIKKDVTKEELKGFFSVLSEKPEVCRENLAELLADQRINNITVEELALNTIDVASLPNIPEEADEKPLDVDALYDLIKSGNIPYSLRKRVLVFFRGNPSQVSSLLSRLSAKASSEANDYSIDYRSKFIHQLLNTLGPIISEEPEQDQESCYKDLASAHLKLDEPLQRELFGSWILPESVDRKSMAGKIVRYINDTELTDIVLSQITRGENAEKMLHLLQSILLSQQERTNFISLLQEELLKIKYGDHDLLSMLGLKSYLRINASLDEEPPGNEVIEITLHYAPEKLKDEERKEINKELNLHLRESTLQVHFCQTVLEILSQEEDQEQQKKVAGILVDSINQIMNDCRYADAATVIFNLTELKSQTDTLLQLRGLIELVIEEIANEQTGRLLSALSEAREAQENNQIQECLKLLGAPAVNMLLDALAKEKEMKKRKIICQSLEFLGHDFIDILASKIEESEWYLVRNIVSIMGCVKSLKATEYLAKTLAHPDSRVRSETISAVAGIRGTQATSLLMQALQDPDLKIACKAAKHLGARKAEESIPELLRIAMRFDPWGKLHELKMVAIESLGRIGSPTALPSLRKLARRRSILNTPKTKILSQEASRAAYFIEKTLSGGRKDAHSS